MISVGCLFCSPRCSPGWFKCLYKSSSSSIILCCSSFLQCYSDFQPNFRYFFRVLKLLCIHGLKQLFCQVFAKGFNKSCMTVLVFCSSSSNVNIMFFKHSCHINFKIMSIITLKYFLVFKHTTLFVYYFQHTCSLTCFLALKLYYYLVSQSNINTCQHVLLCVPFKDIIGHIKQIRLTLHIRFCHIVMRFFFPLGGGIWTCQSACFANHDMISLLGTELILCSSLNDLPRSKVYVVDSMPHFVFCLSFT